MTEIRIPRQLTSSELTQLADLLVATVADGASVGYLPPLPWAKAVAYWQKAIKPHTVLLLAEVDGRIAGTVQLALESRPNGLH
nr:GNAT family N-acetyltransferase [Chloroflexia bacterium]